MAGRQPICVVALNHSSENGEKKLGSIFSGQLEKDKHKEWYVLFFHKSEILHVIVHLSAVIESAHKVSRS